ncbi:MAG: aminotransferase class I/II-fold pyridoxal phosphate-dependent enzyme [Thermoplasmata archaeon]|jgi:tyrosine/nicotianamine family aminotransferase|nr:aminotransferase class I/II-fold pyridoxal phosphate-dependent enzyme [Thermoplasmata archaeon]MBR4243873.1 aminotransferase class I/II-fold pyridoxal phosphate-dependent enzyme [Candidatus Methanomethylophilaceae archaeon]MBR6213253.1 aminotransferase class I/II-fold pyridoxal phosphate-dependent enzyme [Candidatus Methanomethylophilaceae archaeon]
MKTIRASRRSLGMNYAIREVIVPAAEAEKAGKKLYRLNIGDPNKWDFETPEYFKQTLREAVDRVDNGYGDSQGEMDLRQAIVQREKEKNGITISTDDVYVTAGVSECIEVMMGTFLEPGDEVLVPGPGYPSYMQYIHFFEGRTVPYRQIEEEDWKPDMDMIRKRITNRTKAMVLINPNNPTGAVYDPKDIREFGDIAAEYDIPLISDEIYDKIVFDGEFHSASRLKSDVPRIILNGFSKVNLMPGWRMGYCYFMDESGLMDEIRTGMMKQFRARICPNVPCQAAAQASLQGPQDYIVDMNKKLKERAEYSYKRLNEIPLISTRKPKGALYMFPHIDLKGTPWKTDKDFVFDLIREEGVVFVHGSGFCEEFGQDHFRSILLAPQPVLEEAFDKMEKFINRHI